LTVPTRSHVIFNGQLLPRDDALLDIDDLGFLVGDGVFETLRVYGGVPFLLEEHLARLFASLRIVDIEIPWSRDQLLAQVRLLVESNGPPATFARLRITVTRGAGSPPAAARGMPTLLMTVQPYEPPDPALYDRGVDVEMSRHVRQASRWHRVKSTSYQPHLMLRREASSEQVFEVLQWNHDGCLTEGSFTNVFVVDAAGVLHTPLPSEGCLKGITRNGVLTIAAQTDISAHEGGITRAQLAAAHEVFLTGSLVEIVPVRRIDARPVGDSCPGKLTRALTHAYRSFVASVTHPGSSGPG
jgi:branched-subunit amino acid aminotransferase/4-amino-4-deoxychorismate lyase